MREGTLKNSRLLQSVLVAVVLGAALGSGWVLSTTDAQDALSTAVVVRVVDGDTIEVQGEGGVLQTVRLMGVDTPETKHPTRPVEHDGPEAAAFTHAHLAGATVGLAVDRTGDRQDMYGRWLRYVSVRGEDFSARLIREGYARAVRGFDMRGGRSSSR